VCGYAKENTCYEPPFSYRRPSGLMKAFTPMTNAAVPPYHYPDFDRLSNLAFCGSGGGPTSTPATLCQQKPEVRPWCSALLDRTYVRSFETFEW
jgi:hypothetical protein